MANIKISELPLATDAPVAGDVIEISVNTEGGYESKQYQLVDFLNLKPRNLLKPENYTLTFSGTGSESVDGGYVELGGQRKAIFTFTNAASKGFEPNQFRRLTFLNKSMTETDYGVLVALYIGATLVTSTVVSVSPNVAPANYEITSILIPGPPVINPSDTMSIEVSGTSSEANFVITGFIYDFY
jgi:hypothetical protein